MPYLPSLEHDAQQSREIFFVWWYSWPRRGHRQTNVVSDLNAGNYLLHAKKLYDGLGLQPYVSRQTFPFICFSVESYFNHLNSPSHLGKRFGFFTKVSSHRSASLPGFLFRISKISNKLFWVDMPLTVTKWRVQGHAMMIAVIFG